MRLSMEEPGGAWEGRRVEGVWAATRDLQQSYAGAAGDEMIGGGVTAVSTRGED